MDCMEPVKHPPWRTCLKELVERELAPFSGANLKLDVSSWSSSRTTKCGSHTLSTHPGGLKHSTTMGTCIRHSVCIESGM
jgi:hypothetical protein